MLKTAHVALVLSLLLPLARDAAATAPHASFSHGFSSHAAAAPKSSGFGAFSRSSSTSAPAAAPAAAARSSGGFGSFGGGAAPQQSDSALSQQLGKDAAQAKALQTLDQRRAAQQTQQAQNAPQAAPAYAQPAAGGAPQPAPGPGTVIVNQNGGSGLGHVIAGAMIANSINAHARAGYYPGPYANGGVAHGAGASSSGGLFRLFLTLCLLAVIAWGIWFAWKGVQRRRAAIEAANKPNYSFKRN